VIDIEVLGQNAACYVCHMTFVKEELAKVHLANKVTCVKCHGLSEKHANDENIGATKPDIVYPRAAVDGSCQKCHEDHDVPAQRVVARFLERKLPTDRAVICTECHGTHKIDHAAAKPNAASSRNADPEIRSPLRKDIGPATTCGNVLRPVAAELEWRTQRKMWRRLLSALGRPV
jgi:formate-dependent nitrite reductase cytochrome c552 subunit